MKNMEERLSKEIEIQYNNQILKIKESVDQIKTHQRRWLCRKWISEIWDKTERVILTYEEKKNYDLSFQELWVFSTNPNIRIYVVEEGADVIADVKS